MALKARGRTGDHALPRVRLQIIMHSRSSAFQRVVRLVDGQATSIDDTGAKDPNLSLMWMARLPMMVMLSVGLLMAACASRAVSDPADPQALAAAVLQALADEDTGFLCRFSGVEEAALPWRFHQFAVHCGTVVAGSLQPVAEIPDDFHYSTVLGSTVGWGPHQLHAFRFRSSLGADGFVQIRTDMGAGTADRAVPMQRTEVLVLFTSMPTQR